jgi:REP element-mobilizing transposase RayT
MAEPVPLAYGQTYHVYNRGINRARVFVEERNYRHFLKLYASHVVPIVDTFAYCLLPNHFHFLVRIKDVEELVDLSDLSGWQNLTGRGLPAGLKPPSQHFSNLFNGYAKAINKAYDRTRALFQRPFGRIPVTSNAYFVQLVLYIHHNPQKHGLVDDFRAWTHSSYGAHCSQKPTRLARDEVLSWFDGGEGFRVMHQQEADLRLLAPLVGEDFE